ncbi:hypothetical protein [Ruegeria sp. HKCCD8929]|uniref:hypothetical protein n=1 Tax=Ruegeria sp. HKCCD8929 TaxID=2683006 RepID=UPI0014891755|nr:hypothetical protein [Ruegeria sp. HKCCD8929]
MKLSDEVISTLRDYIAYSRDEDGEKIALILKEYQVFFSRWRSRFDDSDYFAREQAADRCEHTTSWAYLYALSSSVFDHARGKNDTIGRPEYLKDNVASALRLSTIIHGQEDNFEEYVNLYQRRYNRHFGN